MQKRRALEEARDRLAPDGGPATAVFIDAENVRGVVLGPLLDKIFKHGGRLGHTGRPITMKAYANWENRHYGRIRSQLGEFGVEEIQVKAAADRDPSAADIHLAVDAMTVSHRDSALEAFVIISGDGGLTPLAEQLRDDGKTVVGVGNEHSSSVLLQEVCDDFLVFTGSGERHPIRRPLPRGWNAGSDSWIEVVKYVVEDLLAEARPVSLNVLIATARAATGTSSFREVTGFANQADAIATALDDSPFDLYRTDDRPDVWLIDEIAYVPDDARIKHAPSDEHELPSFLGSTMIGETPQEGPAVSGSANVSRLIVDWDNDGAW